MPPPHRLLQLALSLVALCAEARPELVWLATKLAKKLEPARHSPGFSSVHWFGTLYSFTHGQAAIVEILWNAWQEGVPDVKGEILLERSGSESGRVAGIFQGNPAWGVMIVPGEARGTFRLKAPEPPQT